MCIKTLYKNDLLGTDLNGLCLEKFRFAGETPIKSGGYQHTPFLLLFGETWNTLSLSVRERVILFHISWAKNPTCQKLVGIAHAARCKSRLWLFVAVRIVNVICFAYHIHQSSEVWLQHHIHRPVARLIGGSLSVLHKAHLGFPLFYVWLY